MRSIFQIAPVPPELPFSIQDIVQIRMDTCGGGVLFHLLPTVGLMSRPIPILPRLPLLEIVGSCAMSCTMFRRTGPPISESRGRKYHDYPIRSVFPFLPVGTKSPSFATPLPLLFFTILSVILPSPIPAPHRANIHSLRTEAEKEAVVITDTMKEGSKLEAVGVLVPSTTVIPLGLFTLPVVPRVIMLEITEDMLTIPIMQAVEAEGPEIQEDSPPIPLLRPVSRERTIPREDQEEPVPPGGSIPRFMAVGVEEAR